METQPQTDEVTQTVAVETPLDLRHVSVSATAVCQHRRDRDARFAWHIGDAPSPPLDVVDTPASSAAGQIAVAGPNTLTLSVPGGTLSPGRWLVQFAVVVRGGDRQECPPEPRHIKLTDPQ